MRFFTFFDEIFIESFVVGIDSGFDGDTFGVISLDESVGFFDMTATNATENLVDEVESALFGGIIRKR